MSASLAIAINAVLDLAVVVGIVSLLGWGIVANRSDVRRWPWANRRRGRDRRREISPMWAHAERRQGERRAGAPIPSL